MKDETQSARLPAVALEEPPNGGRGRIGDSARYKALGNSMAVPQRKREPQRVTMRPSVGRPDPEAVLPLLHRLVEEKSKNDADRERRLLPQVQQG